MFETQCSPFPLSLHSICEMSHIGRRYKRSLLGRIRKKTQLLWLAWALLAWHTDTFLLNQTWLNTCNRLWMLWCLTAPVSGFLHESMVHYQLIHPWNWILKLSASTMLHSHHARGKQSVAHSYCEMSQCYVITLQFDSGSNLNLIRLWVVWFPRIDAHSFHRLSEVLL